MSAHSSASQAGVPVRSTGCGRRGRGLGQRPGQCGPVDLARGPGRQLCDDGQHRHQRGRQHRPQPLVQRRRLRVGIRSEDQVPDQDLVTGLGPPDRRRCSRDAGQRLQGSVDLAQLDPPAAELDLLVGAAGEQQPGAVETDQIPAAISPIPAERGQRGELLGILGRVQVARQTDPADDQLAGRAVGHRLAGLVDHGQVPAVQWQPDPHRLVLDQSAGAGHHGGLGGTVGVPDLAVIADQPIGQFRWAGLAPEDDQPYPVEGIRRPQATASVGTVLTTVIRCSTRNGPRSTPLRTSARGAGTRQAPLRQASHISSHEASKATDRPASTRSPGPIGCSARNNPASASTKAAALRWLTATPFGVPVEPEVKMIQASWVELRPAGQHRVPRAAIQADRR